MSIHRILSCALVCAVADPHEVSAVLPTVSRADRCESTQHVHLAHCGSEMRASSRVRYDDRVWTCSYEAGRFDYDSGTWQTGVVGGSGGCMPDGQDLIWFANDPLVPVDIERFFKEWMRDPEACFRRKDVDGDGIAETEDGDAEACQPGRPPGQSGRALHSLERNWNGPE